MGSEVKREEEKPHGARLLGSTQILCYSDCCENEKSI